MLTVKRTKESKSARSRTSENRVGIRTAKAEEALESCFSVSLVMQSWGGFNSLKNLQHYLSVCNLMHTHFSLCLNNSQKWITLAEVLNLR